jgi:hypothetical protein
MIPIPRCSLSAPSRRRQPLVVAFLLLFTLWSWRSTRVVDDEAFYRDTYPLAWRHVHLTSTRGGGTFFLYISTFGSIFEIVPNEASTTVAKIRAFNG